MNGMHQARADLRRRDSSRLNHVIASRDESRPCESDASPKKEKPES